MLVGECARAPTTIESLYGSSLFRSGHLLDRAGLELSRAADLGLHHCLLSCMQQQSRPSACKAFNYAAHNGTCILLVESLCANETYELTEDHHFSYFDLLNSPDYEVRI